MSDKLKPCPFCGKKNIIIETWSSGGPRYMVKCNNPNCPVPEIWAKKSVIEAWNRRAEQ